MERSTLKVDGAERRPLPPLVRKGTNQMAATKNGEKNATVNNDLLAGLEEEEPTSRANSAKEREPFVPVPALVDRITASFAKGSALSVSRVFPTAKDASAYMKPYLRHAEYVIDTVDNEAFANKSVAVRVLPIDADYASAHEWAKDAVGQFRAKVQMTHKRQPKKDGETPAETPAK